MHDTAAHDDLNALVFNVGSSSLSFKLYRHSEALVRGKCHRVGVHTTGRSYIEVHYGAADAQWDVELPDHHVAASQVLDWLDTRGFEFDVVGHRFADGGPHFENATVIDETTRPLLEQSAPLAPLHNGAALHMVDLLAGRRPWVVQFVVFDSTFHAGLPDVARTYALPREMARRYRKHGFHGLSYADVVEKARWYLGEEHFKAVALHLGTGGSSACAIVDGRSVDTSMGYSPLQGLVMNTRCGDLDPGIIVDLARHGYAPDALGGLLQGESGLLGLSGGTSSDIRDLIRMMPQDPDARLAFDLYVYRARLYVGAYAAAMNGLDLLIFTDDVGLRVPEVRREICRGMDFIGVRLDDGRNTSADPERVEPLHASDSPVRILAIPNDEERAIYDEGLRLLAVSPLQD